MLSHPSQIHSLLIACTLAMTGIPSQSVAQEQPTISTLEFASTPLSEAIQYFRVKSIELNPTGKGINFLIDPRVDQKQLVTLRLRNVPIGSALIYMIDHADLDYKIDSHACVILPKGMGELAKRPPADTAVTAKYSPSIKARKVILDKVEFSEATIDSVLKFLADLSAEKLGDGSGINLVLSQRVDPQIPVSIIMTNVPLSQLLARIASFTSLEIRIEKHAVFLDPPCTKAALIARLNQDQKRGRGNSARRSNSKGKNPYTLGTIPDDPRSPAHPNYVSSGAPIPKRTNSLNNIYKWVNGKWTFVRYGTNDPNKKEVDPKTGERVGTSSLKPATLQPAK